MIELLFLNDYDNQCIYEINAQGANLVIENIYYPSLGANPLTPLPNTFASPFLNTLLVSALSGVRQTEKRITYSWKSHIIYVIAKTLRLNCFCVQAKQK